MMRLIQRVASTSAYATIARVRRARNEPTWSCNYGRWLQYKICILLQWSPFRRYFTRFSL